MISVLAIVVPIVAARSASLLRAAIRNAWVLQEIAADFVFALIILLAPVLFRP